MIGSDVVIFSMLACNEIENKIYICTWRTMVLILVDKSEPRSWKIATEAQIIL